MWNKDLAFRAVGYSLWGYIQSEEHLIRSYLCLHASAIKDFATKKTGADPINTLSPAPAQGLPAVPRGIERTEIAERLRWIG